MHGLLLLCHEKRVALRGKTILKEGDPCDKVIIVLQGEVEIVKSNLSTVFYNKKTGVLAIRESSKKAIMLKSEFRGGNSDSVPGKSNCSLGEISKISNYEGSEFYTTVQKYLAKFVD